MSRVKKSVGVTAAAVAVTLASAPAAFAVPTARPHTGIVGAPASAVTAALGDVDGDGRGDLGVWSTVDCATPFTVVLGGEAGATVDLRVPGPRVLRILRPARVGSPYSCFLSRLGPVGDVDGDGRDDIVVVPDYGAPERIAYGRGAGTVDTDDAAAAWRLEAPGVLVQPRLREVGDVNGDGRADVIIGGSYASPRVAFGRGGGGATDVDALGMQGITLTLPALLPGVTSVVDAPGDVNRDGKADMLVHWTGVAGVSRLTLVPGRALGGTVDITAPGASTELASGTDQTWLWNGNFVGDMDGDGLNDRATGVTNGFSVLLSSRLKIPYTRSQISTTGISVLGNSSLQIANESPLFTAGDQNADGRADLVVSADSIVAGTLRGYVVESPKGATWNYLINGTATARSVQLASVSTTPTSTRLDSLTGTQRVVGAIQFDSDARQELVVNDGGALHISDVADLPKPVDTVSPAITNVTLSEPSITNQPPCSPACTAAARKTTLQFTVSERTKLAPSVRRGTTSLVTDSIWVSAGTHRWTVGAHYNQSGLLGPYYPPRYRQLSAGAYTVRVGGSDLAGRVAVAVSKPLSITTVK